jgi:uncharacterized protein YcnI
MLLKLLRCAFGAGKHGALHPGLRHVSPAAGRACRHKGRIRAMRGRRSPKWPLVCLGGMTRHFWLAVVGGLIAALASNEVASAHVNVMPREAPPESNQTFTVRVPTEREEPTVRVRVEFPPGLTVSRFQPKAGWNRQVERDSEQRITSVTWSGGQIGPGEFEDFALIGRTPRETGQLAFKAYQTYQGGETVEWTGTEGTERPAAFVAVTAAAVTGAAGSGTSIEGSGALAASASPEAAGKPGAAPSAPGATQPSVAAPAGPAAGTNPAATPQASGSDLPLFAALAAAVLSLIAILLSVAALTRRGRAA